MLILLSNGVHVWTIVKGFFYLDNSWRLFIQLLFIERMHNFL